MDEYLCLSCRRSGFEIWVPSQDVILDVDKHINVENTTLFLVIQSVGKSVV